MLPRVLSFSPFDEWPSLHRQSNNVKSATLHWKIPDICDDLGWTGVEEPNSQLASSVGVCRKIPFGP